MVDSVLKESEDRMDKTMQNLVDQFMSVHSHGTGFIDTVKVEYYGSMTPLEHLAQVSLPQPNKILVRPHDPSSLKEIERAINAANLGVTVSKEKDRVWVTIPSMTSERRDKLVKHLSKITEDAKVAIRNIRRDGKKVFDKNKDIPEDDAERGNKKLQELTDAHIEKLDVMLEKKTKKILE